MMMTGLPLLDYDAGQRAKKEGMALAASHSPSFSDAANEALVRIARRQLTVHTDDLLRELGSIRPNHPNAFGAVWARAIHEGVIQRTTERRRSADPKKHCHEYPVYLSLIRDPRSS